MRLSWENNVVALQKSVMLPVLPSVNPSASLLLPLLLPALHFPFLASYLLFLSISSTFLPLNLLFVFPSLLPLVQTPLLSTYIFLLSVTERTCLKKKIGGCHDEKCNLICFLNFHGLLGNSSAVQCVHSISSVCKYQRVAGGGWEGWEAELVSFRTHES